MVTAINGIVHGKTIELEQEPGMADGQKVSVEIRAINGTPTAAASIPWWLARFDVNPNVRPGKFVIKGTSLLADDLVAHLEEGWTEERLLQTHAELAPEDVAAVREYARMPLEMRRSFGAWANDGAELDEYLEWNREQRKTSRRIVE